MSEKPIIFSGPMVRAILEGRKTMTRRVVKPQPAPRRTHFGRLSRVDFRYCSFFGVGRLWVRESISKPHPLDVDNRCFTGFYRATDPDRKVKWRPSIHMPRWACRLVLEITGVKVERLQDITASDAIDEGIDGAGGNDEFRNRPSVENFQILWDSINGEREGCAWACNPWVWAITFKVVKP